MYEKGNVVAPSQFGTWIKQQEQQNAPSTKQLGPYQKQYEPDPTRRGG